MSDRDGSWDEFDAGKKQGRADLIDELAATKVLVGIAEYEALMKLAKGIIPLAKIGVVLAELNKARGK